MKTKEELTALKGEVEAMNKKLAALTDEELKEVTGGEFPSPQLPEGQVIKYGKDGNEGWENVEPTNAGNYDCGLVPDPKRN